MAKWFKDFPINLKNGNERARSASESGPQTRSKPSFSRDSLKGNPRKDGGVGGLLAGRNRKNSAIELGRNNAGSGGTVWDSLTSGKSRKTSRIEAGTSPEEQRQVRSSSLAQAYISRMIKVDKQQDKTPKLTGKIHKAQVTSAVKGIRGCFTSLCLIKQAVQYTDLFVQLIILEDYADPFDAEKTKEQREAERAGVNDGYMEPYDAQVIITEVHRRGSKDLLKVCVLVDRGQTEGKHEEGSPTALNIYDTPYEGPNEGGPDADSEGVWIPVSRPESDVRPAGEYELPWEWRKEDIVRALSAQFEAVDCSASKENSATTRPRQKNWTKTLVSSTPSFPSSPILKLSPLTPPSSSSSFSTLKPLPLSPSSSPNKLSPPSPSSPGSPLEGDAARVDPSLPLEKQSWYHGSVTRQQAEAQLQRCREASFLVRDSESGTSKYSIALKTSHSCVHIIVAQTKTCKGLVYTLDQSSCVFSSIPELPLPRDEVTSERQRDWVRRRRREKARGSREGCKPREDKHSWGSQLFNNLESDSEHSEQRRSTVSVSPIPCPLLLAHAPSSLLTSVRAPYPYLCRNIPPIPLSLALQRLSMWSTLGLWGDSDTAVTSPCQVESETSLFIVREEEEEEEEAVEEEEVG
ncbi:hypothetical protein NQD34_012269 [Periophthalmus magnuspinnatus]|nr:hypothetical protein NQD34_012269 [Periophthalmus magnuspinnatus]